MIVRLLKTDKPISLYDYLYTRGHKVGQLFDWKPSVISVMKRILPEPEQTFFGGSSGRCENIKTKMEMEG